MTPKQLQSIYDDLNLQSEYFTWCIDTTDGDTSKETFIDDYISNNLYGDEASEYILALMQHSGMDWNTADNEINDGYYFIANDKDADKEALEYAESYLEEELYNVPDHLKSYFDDEAFINDYLADGRGHLLAHYDGCENWETVNGTTYYIYRR